MTAAYPAEWEKLFTAKNGVAVHFRPEQASDTEMLWAMFSTLSEATLSNLAPPFTRERVENWTRNIDYSKILTIVAIVEEHTSSRIVGSATLIFNPQEVFQHRADFSITVHDNYQNMGIGTAQLNHLLAIAKTQNLHKISLIANTTNARALHLYRKAGFEVEGILRKEMYYKGKYIDVYRMALFI
jgi:RimJ/RimL family protein N-acetyltransferase